MSNFYLKFKKPKMPTKVYYDNSEAMAWIETNNKAL